MTTILAFAEARQGKLKKAALEAVSAARRLADAVSAEVVALIVGSADESQAQECAQHGADRVLTVSGDGFADYAAETWRDAVLQAIEATGARVALLPATAMGLDVAPRVAARLGVGLLSDVVALEMDGEALVARRPVYAGKAYATARLSSTPAIVTIRPNVFTATAAAKPLAVAPLEVATKAPRARVLRTEATGGQELDVAEAEIVVAGGRGLREPESFKLIRELAATLSAGVGASRAVVDAGWIGHAHQVGQTGKTVSPKLYIACGISGAIQHLAGMSSSKVIVAVNKDPEAPIFKNATYGIAGDLFEVVPALTKALQAYQSRHG